MIRWKSSISPEYRMSSILSLLIFQTLAALFWSPKTHGNISGLSSIGNCYFTNISTSMLIKWSQLSSIWESLEAQPKVLFPFKNNFSIEVVSFLSPSIAINYSFTTESHYHTLLGFLTRCNEELPSGFLAYSVPPLYLRSRPLLVSSPLIFIFAN